jgi:FKBP-type peptidyl-prolyl cis-trans isomerase
MESKLIAMALPVVIFLSGCSDPQKETRDLFNVCVYQGTIEQEICMDRVAARVLEAPKLNTLENSSDILQCLKDAFSNLEQCSKTYWDQGDHVHELDQFGKDWLREDAGLLSEAKKYEQEEAVRAEAAKAEAERNRAESAYRPRIEKILKEAAFTKTGLAYRILTEGFGPKPSLNSTVEVHYTGQLFDGTEFDNSVKRGVPVQFGVTQVIAGWSEVLQLMPEGSKWEVIIPANMAYGSSGAGEIIGPNQDLLFTIELIRSNVE